MRTDFPFSYLFVGGKMKIKPLEEIKQFCNGITSIMGVTVCDVEFKNGDTPTLTVFIKKDGGVDLDTCEKVSNAINEPLDELDPTFGLPYSLNVSSLGIDWAFKADEDFLSHVGERVEVKLKNPIKGKKFYDGILVSYNKDSIALKVDEKNTFTIELKNTVKVNEYVDFN